jgi:hypothetical protein
MKHRRTPPKCVLIPIARLKKTGKQLAFDMDWTQDGIEENRFVHPVRER